MAGPSVSDVKSVAEHWDILWIMVIGLFGVVNFLIWRIIARIEKAIEKIYDCLNNLVPRPEFNEWKDGRRELKEKLENHSHAAGGGVIFGFRPK